MGSYNGGGKMGKNSSQSGGLAGSAGNGNPGAGGKAGGKSTRDRNLQTLDRLAKGLPTGPNTKDPAFDYQKGHAKETIGSPNLPVVPSRTRTLNFKRAPTLSEIETMASIAGGVITGSPLSVAKSIADSLNSPTDFQGAVSQGSGTLDVKGTPGSKEIGDNITEEEKKRRELLARGTLLGATSVGNTLGTPINPTPI